MNNSDEKLDIALTAMEDCLTQLVHIDVEDLSKAERKISTILTKALEDIDSVE